METMEAFISTQISSNSLISVFVLACLLQTSCVTSLDKSVHAVGLTPGLSFAATLGAKVNRVSNSSSEDLRCLMCAAYVSNVIRANSLEFVSSRIDSFEDVTALRALKMRSFVTFNSSPFSLRSDRNIVSSFAVGRKFERTTNQTLQSATGNA
jgi:hypothetical protein